MNATESLLADLSTTLPKWPFEATPGILSDRQIAELCVLPDRVFDVELYRKKSQGVHVAPAMEGAAEKYWKEVRESCVRSLTDEERAGFAPMIQPFDSVLVREVEQGVGALSSRKIISRGLTSYGYDVALSAQEIKLFTNINSTIVDPKRLDPRALTDAEVKKDPDGALFVILPPNSYMLGHTVEYFRIPRDVMVVCLGKSTYARAGAIVNVTPIEPGFEGTVVIEISNSTNLPLKIYLEEGIAQFLFFRGSEACRMSYADRNGKYQGQRGVTLPKV